MCNMFFLGLFLNRSTSASIRLCKWTRVNVLLLSPSFSSAPALPPHTHFPHLCGLEANEGWEVKACPFHSYLSFTCCLSKAFGQLLIIQTLGRGFTSSHALSLCGLGWVPVQNRAIKSQSNYWKCGDFSSILSFRNLDARGDNTIFKNFPHYSDYLWYFIQLTGHRSFFLL